MYVKRIRKNKNYKERIVILNVRTYVNHVRNICHLELANPMTKCTLVVIG